MKKKIFLASLLTLTLACGKKDDNSIVVYTNSGTNGRAEYLTELAKENGFEVNVVFAGGTDISNRLMAEKNNPIADVVFGLNSIEYEKLKKNNAISKYTPKWAGEIPEGLSDKDGYYNAVTVTPLLAIYNPNIIIEEDAPKDWIDLGVDSKYKDKYHIFGLDGGTSKVVLASIASRYKDSNGTLNVSDEGWEVVKQYVQNAHIQKSEEDWFGNMMSGKRPITMVWGSGALERSKANSFEIGIMKPEIGVPFVVEQLALVKGNENNEINKKFIDWLGSAEVQEKWAEKFGTAPAHPKALENAPKETRELVESLKIQNLDWTFITDNIDSWIEKVQLEYVN